MSHGQLRQDLVSLLPRLRRFGYSLSGGMAEADDLVQETCIRVLTRLDQFAEGTRFDSWCFTVLRSIWLNQIRATKVRQGEGTSDPNDLADDKAGNQAHWRLALSDLDRQMARLKPEQREVLMLVCVEGFSYAETADMLQVPRGTVMSRLSRARLALVAAESRPAASGKTS